MSVQEAFGVEFCFRANGEQLEPKEFVVERTTGDMAWFWRQLIERTERWRHKGFDIQYSEPGNGEILFHATGVDRAGNRVIISAGKRMEGTPNQYRREEGVTPTSDVLYEMMRTNASIHHDPFATNDCVLPNCKACAENPYGGHKPTDLKDVKRQTAAVGERAERIIKATEDGDARARRKAKGKGKRKGRAAVAHIPGMQDKSWHSANGANRMRDAQTILSLFRTDGEERIAKREAERSDKYGTADPKTEPVRRSKDGRDAASLTPDQRDPGPKILDGRYTAVFRNGRYRTIRIRTQPLDWDFAPGKQIVSFLSGPDNGSDYTRCAVMEPDARLTFFGKFRGTQTEREIREAVDIILGDDTAAMEEYAMRTKKCARCNRDLTVPASLHRGLGPECAEKWGLG